MNVFIRLIYIYMVNISYAVSSAKLSDVRDIIKYGKTQIKGSKILDVKANIVYKFVRTL